MTVSSSTASRQGAIRQRRLGGALAPGAVIQPAQTLYMDIPTAGQRQLTVRAIVTGGAGVLEVIPLGPDREEYGTGGAQGSSNDLDLAANTEGLLTVDLLGEGQHRIAVTADTDALTVTFVDICYQAN